MVYQEHQLMDYLHGVIRDSDPDWVVKNCFHDRFICPKCRYYGLTILPNNACPKCGYEMILIIDLMH